MVFACFFHFEYLIFFSEWFIVIVRFWVAFFVLCLVSFCCRSCMLYLLPLMFAKLERVNCVMAVR